MAQPTLDVDIRENTGDNALGAAAVAGIVGALAFTTGFLAQDLLRGGYDPVAQQISELEAGAYGWVQQVNFMLFGLLVIVFAVGLHLGVRAGRTGVVGPAILAWNGVGLVIAGLVPLRADAAGMVVDPGGWHHVNGAIYFGTIGLGLVVVSRRLAGDPRWRGLTGYSLVSGIVLLVVDVIEGPLSGLRYVTLDPWSGLLQRVTIGVWLACVVVLALRLRRVAGVPVMPTLHDGPEPQALGGPLHTEPDARADTSPVAIPRPDTPRWVMVSWSIVLAVLVLFVATLVTVGPHRPGGHASSGHAGGRPAAGVSPADTSPAGGQLPDRTSR